MKIPRFRWVRGSKGSLKETDGAYAQSMHVFDGAEERSDDSQFACESVDVFDLVYFPK